MVMPGTYAVILAGGRGTRFWPVSRREKPKQFLAIAGGGTMIQNTVERIAPLIPSERTLIVGSVAHGDLLREQLPDIPANNLLLEPEGRNTAAAVHWAASEALSRAPDAVLIVLSADHHIANPDVFRQAVTRAVGVAGEHRGLVLYGLEASEPVTRYGYIVPDGPAISGGEPHAYSVRRFHEKPPTETATRYIAEGCFWNSGMFTWRANVILEELSRYAPDIHKAGTQAMSVMGTAGFEDAYAAIPSISIDHAVLDHSDCVYVVDSRIDRVDLGNWSTVAAVLPRDTQGNVISGDVVSLDSRESVHVSDGRLIATIGVDELIIVATGDVVLVCPRDRASEVNAIVKTLESDHPDLV
jgi:mannose-1-phosphate guanylyltransferase